MLRQIYTLKMLKDWAHCRVLLKNLCNIRTKISSSKEHMNAAMDWLCSAQDVSDCGGVSAGFSLHNGWRKAYPETTGYIIKTFIKYSHYADDNKYLNRAITMGDWEIEIQLNNGAVRGGVGLKKNPVVFNTGQVILGWIALYKETKLEQYKKAAERAANWLLEIQDEDGKWSKYVYLDIPHSYHTEVAWSILEVFNITKKEKYFKAAKKQILWVLSNAKENGWFEQAAFTKESLPITHTIGYTLQGLLESAKFFESELKQKIVEIVNKACLNIMSQYEDEKRNGFKFLQASFDENWNSLDKYSCLTGDCQIAICFMELYKKNNDARLLNAALKIIDQVKSTQIIKSNNKGIQGGIQGSYPIWGKYRPYNYPNWAAKYFVDALLLQEGNKEL